MKRRNNLILLLIFIVTSCERIEYYPDKPITFTKTIWMAHKGGGYFDEGNRLESVKHGLSMLGDIEIDLQRSTDNTVWLSHSTYTISCGSIGELCIPGTSDNTLNDLNACLPAATNYPTLESIFSYVSANYPEAVISLDVKPWNPCGDGVNIISQMNDMAKEIIRLVSKYNLQHRVLVESQVGDFLYYFQQHTTDIETYLITLGDFELGMSRALAAGFSGISFQYGVDEVITNEHIDMLHRKGLKIIVWTIDEPEMQEEVKSLRVDFAQTNIF
jgi:glycerophosphoryl diester phosphodiesterase